MKVLGREDNSIDLSRLRVSEIFYSLQGEGVAIGTPSVFLRMALCNLSCSWCDTKYTWDWNNYNYHKEVREVSVIDTYQEIEQYGVRNVVITGGEPMLQQAQLVPVVETLHEKDHFIEVETNGTILPLAEFESAIGRWNVSPKLNTSNSTPSSNITDKSYKYFAESEKSFFKFVVGDKSDLEDIEDLVRKFSIAKEKVVIMPQCVTTKEFFDRSDWISEYCKRMHYRFSPRLQILLWSNKRGR